MNIDKIKNILFKYYEWIIIVFLILVIIILIFTKEKEIITNEIIKECEQTNNEIKVDIKGSVKNPGVYILNENDRIIDLIEKSGGLLENANTSNINLSKSLQDQMVIYIYNNDEINALNTKNEPNVVTEFIEKECICPIVNNNACVEPKEIVNNYITNYYDKKEDNNEQIEQSKNEIVNENIQNDKISLNKASKQDLMKIPGIGESKADKIIEYRDKQKFNNIEDIKNVSGIGESIFEKIKDYISI